MKKRRFGLLLNIAVLCLCVCAIAIGVYSVKNAQLNVTGTIGFQAHNCKVRIKATVDGYASTSSLNTNAITGTNGITVGQTSADSSYSWDVGTLIFDDMDTTIKKPVKDIVFTFTVTNLSDFYIDYEVNRECINNSRIRIYNPNQGATLAPASVVGNGATEGESLTFTVALQLLADSEGKYTDLNNFTFNASELVKFYKSQAPAFLDNAWVWNQDGTTEWGEGATPALFVRELGDTTNFEKDSEGNIRKLDYSLTSGVTEAGTTITTDSKIYSYYDTVKKQVIVYSPARIYAPKNINKSSLSATFVFKNFDTSLLTDMSEMFMSGIYTGLDVVDTSNVTDMRAMFGTGGATINGSELCQFNTENVTDMSQMFMYAHGETGTLELDLTNFNTSKVTNMSSMFKDNAYYSVKGLEYFDTSLVTDMSYMFGNETSSESDRKWVNLDLSSFNTENVTTMANMFDGCLNLQQLNISNFNTSKVVDMTNMFNYCRKLQNLDVSSFNTSNVTSMTCMFTTCEGLSNIDLSGFNTSNVLDMTAMFAGCENLKILDLSSFNTSKVNNMSSMFGSSYLTTIYVSNLWSTAGLTDSTSEMFRGCSKLVGGAGTACDGENNIDATYARIDGGTSAPGYFTTK